MKFKLLFSLFSIFYTFVPVQAQILEKIVGSVATFSDVAVIIYESLNPVSLVKAQKENTKNQEKQLASMQDIDLYLKNRGIDVSVNSQPISKQEFAKILYQRFQFSSSLLTKTTGIDYLYFKDAKNLGIFESSDNESDTLTTQDMFKAYFKALQLKR